MPHTGLRSPECRDSAVIFIGGFNAGQAVRAYIDHLLKLRPNLRERVQQFSCRDNPDHIVKQVISADGPVTLVGNSLGAATAAEVAVRSRQVQALVTLAPVGSFQIDFCAIAASVSAWINLKTPVGIADLAALSLSQGCIGPWGYGPEPHATRFIDSHLGHAEFWPQMDAVVTAGLHL
jgi:pimeloyl-ACP methyl ester carboxylesterase